MTTADTQEERERIVAAIAHEEQKLAENTTKGDAA